MSSKKTVLIIISLLFLVFIQSGQALDLTKKYEFYDKHMFGGRVGAYSNTSDEVPSADEFFSPEFKSGSMYAEFFYAHRLIEPIMLELSMGVFKRGEIQYDRGTGLIDKAVLIYPFLLSARIYPFYKMKSRVHLFLQPGMAVIYGRRDIVDPNYIDISSGEYLTSTESRASWTYFLGAGLEYQLLKNIAITSSVKYMPADFKEPLAGVEDYTGWTLTFGIGYLINKKN